MKSYVKGEHPGSFIRREILMPTGMSVTAAAKRLDVSRPTLSNLLNGNASLSPEMALRLERVFGASKEELLQAQAAYDNSKLQKHEPNFRVRSYVPSFLEITADQIASWAAEQLAARSLLPVLLRRLVVTTGEGLEKVDFPGHDNAQRPGWDGQVQASVATPWIPAGTSGWEFGCDQNVRRKADDDFENRTRNTPPAERKEITFVFVTPRNWKAKDTWAKERSAQDQWKDVRVLDASDLEQWLEQSVPVQSWMSEKLGINHEDVLSLDRAWDRWAKVTEPELSKTLFDGSVRLHRDKLARWLAQPAQTPFVITADSKDEALAFLSRALEVLSTSQDAVYDRSIVLRSAGALGKISEVSANVIIIIVAEDAEAESAGIHKTRHTIIVRHQTVGEDEPEISLDLVDDKTFEKGLLEMGIPREEIPVQARESGQSVTVLRRRLAKVPAIKSPPWAEDNDLSRSLIPLWMIGAWDSQKEADQEVVAFLTDRKYADVEQSVAELLSLPDSPLWAAGRYRGVVSKIDVLFATHHLMTRAQLERFLSRARVVLAEKDPALDLPAKERWMAAIHNKTRNHSTALRRSMCDSLVLLAVYGSKLLEKRLPINVENEVNAVIRQLLTPITADTLASQERDLPYYAEAAPDVFLDLLEEDIRTNSPAVMSLMKPADSGIFGGGCPRTGLLWALELLAWKPERLPRSAMVLARLSECKIEDNWVNKPEASLHAIFRAEMPQTAASIEQRGALLAKIARKFPDVGWRLCMDEFLMGGGFATDSYRPRWRRDAAGAGHVMPNWGLVRPFKEKALQIAFDWPSHNAQTLGDLVERLQMMPEDYQAVVWRLAREWAATGPPEDQKASLKERIRRFAFTRHGRNRKLSEATRKLAQEAQSFLEPSDLIARHTWLFEKQWVEESLEEIEDKKFDYQRHEERVSRLRNEALKEVWETLGYDGVVRLFEVGDASSIIGWSLADILGDDDAFDLLYRLCSEPSGRLPAQRHAFLHGFLLKFDTERRRTLLEKILERFAKDNIHAEDKSVRLLIGAPFDRSTWSIVDTLSSPLRGRYWKEVHPNWLRQHSAEDQNYMINQLISVGRSSAAFHAIHFVVETIDSEHLLHLLRAMPTSDESIDHYRMDRHAINEAFKALDSRADVNKDELARLEFVYLEVLGHGEHGVPNLERQIAKSPMLFVQALALVFKRKDDGSDPPEWGLAELKKNGLATKAYRLLHDLRRLPGAREDGTVDKAALQNWIVEVRALCHEHAREHVGDVTIGELLSKSSEGKDGIWPREEIRDVLEEVGTTNIANGMAIGRQNARGAHFREPGGKQERELAAHYRDWAKQVSFDWPFTARLLEDIAKSYDHEAQWHDVDDTVQRRLTDL